jgi:predicted nicotinamide N-methyase
MASALSAPWRRLDLVEELVALPGAELSIVRPRSSEALLDEEAFEREEFLPYWAEPWPSGLALARTAAGLPLAGTAVLELGCGLALPAIVAALAGARVLATDWSPDAVALARLNARRNGAELETAVSGWETSDRLGAGWDVVLAADVLYEHRNAALLLRLLPQVVREGGTVMLADPGRPHARLFLEQAAERWTIETAADALVPTVALHRLRPRT